MSLRGLLDYTEDDTAAATFEASMFGELFLEMLQARFGRAILRTLPVISQQVAPFMLLLLVRPSWYESKVLAPSR